MIEMTQTRVSAEEPRELSSADETLLEALAAGKFHREAAAIAGLSLATVARRMRQPWFKAELTERRAVFIREHADTATRMVKPSLDTLAELRDNPDTASALRRQCCVDIIDIALKLRTEADVLPRIAALEAGMVAPGE